MAGIPKSERVPMAVRNRRIVQSKESAQAPPCEHQGAFSLHSPRLADGKDIWYCPNCRKASADIRPKEQEYDGLHRKSPDVTQSSQTGVPLSDIEVKK